VALGPLKVVKPNNAAAACCGPAGERYSRDLANARAHPRTNLSFLMGRVRPVLPRVVDIM